MKDLIIIGASGFGREVLQWAKDVNKVKPTWNVKGFIDDNPNALASYKCDKQVLGNVKNWTVSENEVFTCAIAMPEVKMNIVKAMLEKQAEFVSVIHPKAVIGDFCKLGNGLIITPNAKVSPNVTLGDFVTLLGSGVGHDASLGDFCTIAGYCSINGNVEIGEGSFVASNSCIAPKKKVGNWAFVGMGSMVITNVKSYSKVLGNPAKRINF